MTQASEELEGPEAAMAYLTSLGAGNKEAVEATEPVEQVEEAASTEVSEVEAEAEGTQETEPEVEADAEESVFDFLPDEIRQDFKGSLTKEQAEALRPLVLMQADYTRKTQKLAADRKQMEASLADAEAYQALTGDPEFLTLLAKAKELQASESEDFDYTLAEAKEVDERVERIVKKTLKSQAPVDDDDDIGAWRTSLVEPMQEAKLASGLSDADWLAATNRLADQLEKGRLDPVTYLTSENVAAFISPHIEAVKFSSAAAREVEARKKSKADATRSAKASSPPPSRSSTTADPKPWVAEKRPATGAEVLALTLKQLSDAGIDTNSVR